MDIVTKIRNQARSKLKTIVLPEYDDARVVEASGIIEKEGIAKVLLLTRDKIEPNEKQRYIKEFYELHKAKDIDLKELAKETEGKVGADIEFICRKASMLAIREYIESQKSPAVGGGAGKNQNLELKISKQHFEETLGLVNTKDASQRAVV